MMKESAKQINFTPAFMVKEKSQRWRIINVAVITFVVTLFCFAIYYIPVLKAFSLSIQSNNINTEMRALGDAKTIKEKFDKILTRSESKSAKLEEIDKNDIDILFIYDKINATKAKGILLSGITISGRDNISINYVISNPLQIADLVESLKNSNLFESVTMPNVPILDRETTIIFRLKLKSGVALRKNLLETVAAEEAVVPPAANTQQPATKPVEQKSTTPAQKSTTTKATTPKKTPTKATTNGTTSKSSTTSGTTKAGTTSPTNKSTTSSTTNSKTTTGATGTTAGSSTKTN